MQERSGNAHPIAYASRRCTAAENNYSITEHKTLAVIYCLEHFRDIILGYKIRVWSDHTAIQYLFKYKNLRGRLAHQFVTPQNYEVNFEYEAASGRRAYPPYPAKTCLWYHCIAPGFSFPEH